MSAGAASGLHVRAGNAMGRTRDGLLDGALGCIERDGLKHTTMAGIAVRAGVAKATLYNHFRTKPGVLAGLVAREVDRVADLAAGIAADGSLGSLAAALDLAAAEVGGLVAVRRTARSEPGALAPLLTVADGPGWRHARGRAAEVLGTADDSPMVELVLRWLCSQLLAPQSVELRAATAQVLARAARPGA